MSHTKDNDKKARDNQAHNAEKNVQYRENLEAGKQSDPKQPDHK